MSEKEEMQVTWKRFKALLTVLQPGYEMKLRPGNDNIDIERLEQQLNVLLPEEVKDFFRLHNGSEGPLPDSWEFLSLQQIFLEWEQFKEQSVPTTPPWQGSQRHWYGWDETWFPLLRSSLHRWLFMRIDPKEQAADAETHEFQEDAEIFWYGIPRERLGTLFITDLSGLEPTFVAASISELLEDFISALERDDYSYDLSKQQLWPTLSPYHPLTEVGYRQEKISFGFSPKEENISYITYGRYPGRCVPSYQQEYNNQVDTLTRMTNSQVRDHLHFHLKHLAPEIEKSFREGASPNDFQQAEERLQVQLPEEVKVWYRWHNGTLSGRKSIVDLWSWYSLENICSQWEEKGFNGLPSPERMEAVDSRIQSVWWHPLWLPFMAHEDGSLLCIDLAPGPEGQEGQIILLFYQALDYQFRPAEQQEAPILWVAPSLHVFFAILAQDLARGIYTFDTNSQMLWSLEGLNYMQGQERLQGTLKSLQENVQKEKATKAAIHQYLQPFIIALENLSASLVERLRPGATGVELAEAEHWFDFFLPEQIRAFFSVQNGSEGPILGDWAFLSLQEMYAEWQTMNKRPHLPRSERQDNSWYQWDASWLPLLRAGTLLRVAFNMQPLMWGEQEVLFLYSVEGTTPLPIIATDIPELLEQLTHALARGCYTYDAQTQQLKVVEAGSPLP